MNKYQDALNKIVKSCCSNCIDENGCSSCDIEKICNATAKSWVNTLQELVDKETPNKPSYLNYGGYKIGNWHCPKCDNIVDKNYGYCKHCGQKLEDWSDEDE